RICDDPVQDRVEVKVPVDTLQWMELQGLHGETAIFRRTSNERILPSVKNMGSKAIVLACYRGKQRRFLEIMNSLNDILCRNIMHPGVRQLWSSVRMST
ncbi:hypothetical protein PENTCL1PPCAC_8517, partial [Pristionchus entomophagus]